MEKDKVGQELTKDEIVEALKELGITDEDMDLIGNIIDGEYKNHSFEIDDENRVIVSEKIKGEKPQGTAEIITKQEGLEEVQIQVIGTLAGGTITLIEPISEGVELKEEKSSTEKIYIVRDNGEYIFRIKGSNNRNIKISCNVTNAIPPRNDLIDAVAKINNNGLQKVKITGKTSEEAKEETIIYSLNVIRIEGDVVFGEKFLINGEETIIEGISHSGTTYSVGSQNDVGSANTYAQNTVVLKVEGSLTINSGITLTSVTSLRWIWRT